MTGAVYIKAHISVHMLNPTGGGGMSLYVMEITKGNLGNLFTELCRHVKDPVFAFLVSTQRLPTPQHWNIKSKPHSLPMHSGRLNEWLKQSNHSNYSFAAHSSPARSTPSLGCIFNNNRQSWKEAGGLNDCICLRLRISNCGVVVCISLGINLWWIDHEEFP